MTPPVFPLYPRPLRRAGGRYGVRIVPQVHHRARGCPGFALGYLLRGKYRGSHDSSRTQGLSPNIPIIHILLGLEQKTGLSAAFTVPGTARGHQGGGRRPAARGPAEAAGCLPAVRGASVCHGANSARGRAGGVGEEGLSSRAHPQLPAPRPARAAHRGPRASRPAARARGCRAGAVP